MSDSNPQNRDDSLAPAEWMQIEEACDRFEQAWDSGGQPRLEEFIERDWPKPQQTALLRDLLIVELDRRLAKGEHPNKQEYRQRFADDIDVDDVDVIEEAFAAQESPETLERSSGYENQQDPERAADWHLVFGLLALQNGLISSDQLVAAFARWTSDKTQPLDQILVEQEAIVGNAVEILRQLVKLHVQQLGNDPHRTLMTLSGSDLPAAKEDLAQLDDADLEKSIAVLSNLDSSAALSPAIGEATSTIARFRILRRLPGAKGGMGEISIARDEELGRQVALKQILSDKADHAAYRQKFQVEAEITGNLEHPGIVPIYGLGIGKDGRPYYAMRLVHGDNLSGQIKEFHQRLAAGDVDYNSVEFHGLVDRLIDVAQAIRYAHSRGVLHRDLKPGNILVGKYGETLVIDWGLARLPQADGHETKESSSESQLDSMPPLNIRSGSNVDATMQGQILGTVGYAPPEQLNGRVDLITERSDVYALGAILYQVLLGEAPISTKGRQELNEVIRDTIDGKIVPPRRQRRAVPKALSAVCMKALDREPGNRYATVEDFISELENWKADQPVAAAPDSLADRVMRSARRYRTAALASAAALVGIVVVAGIALVFVNRARLNEADARSEAETLAKRNQTVVDSFVAAFRSPDPENEGVTSKMTALEVLEQALAEIETDEELARDELTKATLLNAIGHSLYSLGQYNSAISAFEDALRLRKSQLAEEHPDRLTSVSNLALAYQSAGRPAEALPLFEETLRLRKTKLGEEHTDTLHSMNRLAAAYQASGRLAEAVPLYEQTLRLTKTKLGEGHRQTLTSMDTLAAAYVSAGRLTEAVPLHEETLRLRKIKLGEEHPDTLVSMNNLAYAYQTAGRPAEAIPLLEETLRLSKNKLGEEHPNALHSMNNLALAYDSAGQLAEALPLYEETLRLTKNKLGEEHPSTLSSMNNLATAYQTAGQLTEAIPLLQETLRLFSAKLGEEHPGTLTIMNNLAGAYESVGRLAEAIPLYEETLLLLKAKMGEEHPYTLMSMNNLAFAYKAAGRLAEAVPLYEKTLRLQKTKLGEEHPDTLQSMNNLASAYKAAGRLTEAVTLYEKTLPLRNTKLGQEHPHTLQSMNNLAVAYKAAGRLAEAIPLYEETLRFRKTKFGEEHLETLASMRGLQAALLQSARYEEAKEICESWIEVIERSATPDRPQLARARTSLAEALLGMHQVDRANEQIDAAVAIQEMDELQRIRADSIRGAILTSQGDWEQAEQLLVDAIESLASQLAEVNIAFHWYVPRACERVIEMYEAWRKPEDVAQWKAKLEEVNAEIERLRNRDVKTKDERPSETDTSNTSEDSES